MNTGLQVGLGTVAGAFAARVADEAMPDTKLYTVGLGSGREAVIRPTAAVGIAALVAGIMGVRIPGGPAVMGLGIGMLGYEAVMEVGDDVAALVLGLPSPGASTPAPVAGLPVPGQTPAAFAGYYPGGGVPDYNLNAAMQGLGFG
ncbi:MAG: hypothetical protein QUS11_06495 [Candidatus Fermentibacter sp.]|nr:hypothetical protein [Candidatus Fermentibacter sp.]